MSLNELEFQPKGQTGIGLSKTQKNFKSAKGKKGPFRKL
jgi:hypothetical protein